MSSWHCIEFEAFAAQNTACKSDGFGAGREWFVSGRVSQSAQTEISQHFNWLICTLTPDPGFRNLDVLPGT